VRDNSYARWVRTASLSVLLAVVSDLVVGRQEVSVAMSSTLSGQKLLIQLETALHRLVEGFWDEPYRCFTSADALAALQPWLARRPELGAPYRSSDGFETGLLHGGYPTSFGFSEDGLTASQDLSQARGSFDLVVVDPAYLQGQRAEALRTADFGVRAGLAAPPLLAAVEVRLFGQGWGPAEEVLVLQDLVKLRLALEPPADVTAAYLCLFIRDLILEPALSLDYSLAMEKALAGFPDIRTVAAISWPARELAPYVHYDGPWITATM
jgi:hypothetical protein